MKSLRKILTTLLLAILLASCAPKSASIPPTVGTKQNRSNFSHVDGVDFNVGMYEPLHGSWPKEIMQWEKEINAAAIELPVPANLIAAIISVESTANDKALSPNGCIGLMQVCPEWIKSHYSPEANFIFPNIPTEQDLWNSQINIAMGTYHLFELSTKYWLFNDPRLKPSYELEYAVSRYSGGIVADDLTESEQRIEYVKLVYHMFISYSK